VVPLTSNAIMQPSGMITKPSQHKDSVGYPTVSVVIPTYNRSQVIARTIKSVQQQTFSANEIIVVDDASTDNTVDVVSMIDENRLKMITHRSNRFAGAARNTGITEASGQLIAFLDSDDVWYPTKLEEQIDCLLKNPSASFCLSGIVMKSGRGLVERVLLPNLPDGEKESIIYAFMMGKVNFVTSTLVIRKSVIEDVGLMDTTLRRNQDMDFFLRLCIASKGVAVQKPLCDLMPNAKLPSLEIIEQSNRIFLRKHRDFFEKNLGKWRTRRIFCHWYFRHAIRHIERGSLASALSWAGKSFFQIPFVQPRSLASALFKLIRRFFRRISHAFNK
jgi:glycosyltransferase involved in cell wall biosynthesis